MFAEERRAEIAKLVAYARSPWSHRNDAQGQRR